jgi:NNP family nitrate/nitrite transporter-like MFS transporter
MANNVSPARRWYVVFLGATINFVAFALSTAAMPVLFSEISGELGLDIVQIGTVWGASSVAGIFSILTAGILADRFGARRILTIFCLMAGVFGALRGFADSFLTLTITSLLFGLAAEAVPVIVIKNASLWFHDRGLGTAQGIITAFVGGGMMLGAMLSATVLSPWLGGWNNVMFFYGGISVLIGILWFFTVPEPAKSETSASSPRQAFSYVRRVKGLWFIAVAMMGFAGCNKGLMGYLPLYLRNSGWTAAGADGALAVLNAAGTAAAIPLTLLSDKLGLRKSILIPGLIATIIGVGMLSVTTGPAVWLLVILAGITRDVIWAIAATITVETKGIGPVYAGIAVGIVHAFTRIGYTFSPPAGNSLATIQAGLPFVFWAGLTVLALISFSFVMETGKGRKSNPSPAG